MLEQKDRAERRVKKAKVTLMRNPKFALWSGIMMVGKTIVDDECPSAYTNGRDEVYGRSFIEGLEDRELAFVVLHENLHKALRHLFIWKKLYAENATLANQACDYVINLMIRDMDSTESVAAMPRRDGKMVGLLDEKYRGMNTKQVFDLLKEGGEGEGDGGDGFDTHDWEGAKGLPDEEVEALEKAIDQALRQGYAAHNKHHGDKGRGLSREIGDLLNPEIDWKEAMREFVKSLCHSKDTSSWRRVNRRYLAGDIYMPSLVGERVDHIVVGVDTSGSIRGSDLNKFLSEVQGIVQEVNPGVLDLIYWDSEVAAHEQYGEGEQHNIVSSTKPKGGGGTCPAKMAGYLKEKRIAPECVVMLTDGDIGEWGEWDVPVLWVVADATKSRVAPVGKTVFIKE